MQAGGVRFYKVATTVFECQIKAALDEAKKLESKPESTRETQVTRKSVFEKALRDAQWLCCNKCKFLS